MTLYHTNPPPGFFVHSLIVMILGLIGWSYYYLFKNYAYYGVHYWCWGMYVT